MKYFKLKIDKKGIATLLFDTPKSSVNVFNKAALEEFKTTLGRLAKDQKINALFIESAKESIFIAGADIHEIKEAKEEKQILAFVKNGQDIFNRLESLPFPTIAMIDGACLGGGLEMSLACSYRIASTHADTRIGLPEVQLGIIPGFGGTQRLYPLVGYAKAMELMVGSKRLKGEKALKLGLVDACVPRGYLAFKKEEFIQEILAGTLKVKIHSQRKGLKWYEKLSLVRMLIGMIARKNVIKKTGGHYPAPLAVIDVMQKTFGKNLQEGLKIEREEEVKLALSPVSKNLIELYFISEALKHETFSKSAPKVIHQSAVVGTGTMGSGIAWALDNQDIDIRLKVRSNESAANAIAKIRQFYTAIQKRGRLSEREVALKMDKITFSTTYTGFESSDFLLEAVSEDLLVKQNVYQEFETVLAHDAIIATNTSSISISDLAQKLSYPNRFIGMHFFNPVNRMPLVEIIAGHNTDDKTIATVVHLSKQMGKTPIKVKESAGFLVNRILMPYLNEAALMFEEGEFVHHIDQTLLDFGMPMGPFRLIDTVGIDIGVHVSAILYAAYAKRMQPAAVMAKMMEKEWLGVKRQKGFYDYSGNKPHVNAGISAFQLQKTSLDDLCIQQRALFIMINEASRCLEESVVDNARYLDMALVMGAGFPAFRGGLMRYADSLGIESVVTKLNQLRAAYGERFAPAELLLDMAQRKATFYGGA